MTQQVWRNAEREFKAREQERFASSIRTFVALSDGREITIQLRDISTGGFAGRSIHDLEPGSHLTLLLPDAEPVRAEVVWQIGPTVGGRFLSSLPSGQVTALIDPDRN